MSLLLFSTFCSSLHYNTLIFCLHLVLSVCNLTYRSSFYFSWIREIAWKKLGPCWHNHINTTSVIITFTTGPSGFDKTRQTSLSLHLQPLYRPVQSTHADAWNTLDGLCLTSCFCLLWLFYHKASISCFYHCLPISHRLGFREPLEFFISYWEATHSNFFFLTVFVYFLCFLPT